MQEIGIMKRLDEVEKKYEEIEKILSDPGISSSDIHRYSKERSEITEVVEIYRQYKKTLQEIEENKALLQDKELGELVRSELDSLEEKRSELEEKLRIALLPRDPNDSKNVFLEIRAGTGGEEAGAIVLHPHGNFNPHQVERAGELGAHVRDAGGPPAFPILALLVQDRVAMIEPVEQLREAERILRQHREFEGAQHLLDDVVEARRLEDEVPERVVVFAVELI